MTMPTSSRRRWFQFSLSSLLWLMLTVAFAIYGFSEHQQRVRTDANIAAIKATAQRQLLEIETLKRQNAAWLGTNRRNSRSYDPSRAFLDLLEYRQGQLPKTSPHAATIP
jgi:type VI protein secretion system component VasK